MDDTVPYEVVKRKVLSKGLRTDFQGWIKKNTNVNADATVQGYGQVQERQIHFFYIHRCLSTLTVLFIFDFCYSLRVWMEYMYLCLSNFLSKFGFSRSPTVSLEASCGIKKRGFAPF